jgi:formylglycine-generating enzyme required for sulfatase activity
VWEWNETAYDGSNNTAGESRYLRGGSWVNDGGSLDARYDFGFGLDPSLGDSFDGGFGFRVASVPEPSSLSLLALGGVVVALRRRQKRA